MEPNQEKKQNSGIIILGVIAILALVIAWFAFNRSGEDVLPTIADESQEAAQELETEANQAAEAAEEEVDEAAAEARLAAARLEAKTELAAVEARVEAGEAYEDVADDIDAIQADLEVAYENASAEAREGWEETKDTFANLEQGLRDGAGDVLEFFAEISLSLETDVRVDEEEEIELSEDDV